MKSLNKLAVELGLILCILVLTTACKREKPTIAKVEVVNVNNEFVTNAEVILFPNPNPVNGSMIDQELELTGQDGCAIFNFTDDFNLGQAGFRVLDIAVNSGDTLFGTGIIKIVEEEINTVKVIVSGT